VEKKIKRRDGARSHAARSSVPSSRSAFVFPAWQWHSGSVRKRSGEINYARTPISMSRSLGRKRQRARARALVRFSFSLAPVRSLAIASRIRNYHSLIPRCSSSGPVTVRESLRRVALLGIEHAGRISSANMLTVHAPTVLNDTELSGDYDSFARSRARGDLFFQRAAPLIDSFRGSPSLVGHTA